MVYLKKRTVCSLVVLTLLLVCFAANAQFKAWAPEDGVMVRQGNHFTWTGGGAATDDSGSWLAAWSDGKEGAQNVYVQLYNSANEQQWTEGGIQLTDLPTPQQQPMIRYAGDGEWLVAWEEYRNNGNASLINFALQRLSSEGEALWQENGVLLNPDGVSWTFLNTFLPMPDQATLVVWESVTGNYIEKFDHDGNPCWDEPLAVTEYREAINAIVNDDGTFMIATGTPVEIQLYDGNGEAQWNDGQPIALCPEEEMNSTDMELVKDDQNGYCLVWLCEERDGIFGQYISAEGEPLWEECVQLSAPCNYISNDDFFRLCHLHDGVCALAWPQANDDGYNLQMRLFDYSSDQEEQDDICQFRVFPDENMVFYCVRLFPDGEDGFILATSNSYGKYSGSAILAMRFSDQGVSLWNDGSPVQFEIDGLPCPYAFDLFELDDYVRLFWPGVYSSGDGIGVQFQQLELASGESVFEQPYPLVSGIMNNGRLSQVLKSQDDVLIGWVDFRDSSDVYFQKLDIQTGETLFEDHGVPLAISYEGVAWGMNNFQALGTEDGGFALLTLRRDGGYGDPYEVFIQTYDSELEPVWDSPTCLTTSEQTFFRSKTQNKYQFLRGSNGCYYVSWVRRGNGVVACNRISQTGELLWGEDGSSLTAESYVLKGAVLLDNNNYGVLFQNRDLVYLTLLDEEGEAIWETPRAQVTDGMMPRSYAPVVRQLGDDILVLWLTEDRMCLYGQLVDAADGSILWDTNGREIISCMNALPVFIDETVVINEDNTFWIAWLDRQDEERYRSPRYQKFNAQGEPLYDVEHGILLPTAYNDVVKEYNTLYTVPDGNNGFFVFYQILSDCDYSNLGFSHINADGDLFDPYYEEGGLILTDAMFVQEELFAIPDGEGGALVSWTDYRGMNIEDEGDDVYAMRIYEYPYGANEPRENLHPVSWELHGAYPNPFNPSTTLSFTAPRTSEVTLSVYDVLGRKVATLVDGVVQAGRQQVIWQGHSDQGMPVASGTYFVRLESDGVNLTSKMVLLK